MYHFIDILTNTFFAHSAPFSHVGHSSNSTSMSVFETLLYIHRSLLSFFPFFEVCALCYLHSLCSLYTHPLKNSYLTWSTRISSLSVHPPYCPPFSSTSNSALTGYSYSSPYNFLFHSRIFNSLILPIQLNSDNFKSFPFFLKTLISTQMPLTRFCVTFDRHCSRSHLESVSLVRFPV